LLTLQSNEEIQQDYYSGIETLLNFIWEIKNTIDFYDKTAAVSLCWTLEFLFIFLFFITRWFLSYNNSNIHYYHFLGAKKEQLVANYSFLLLKTIKHFIWQALQVRRALQGVLVVRMQEVEEG